MNKKTIIDEIKRTATDNGGKPLGHRKLETETSIRPSDWGKYWSRFGDAQREAGFEPNAKTAAFDEDDLARQLAMLARSLGRFPTHGDIRVKSHSDVDFPSSSTYDHRFRSKSVMTAKVNAVCSQHPEFNDVLQWCEVSTAPKDTAKADFTDDGFVYLLKSGRFYKIGRTNSVGRRERELTIQLPEEAKTVHHIKTDDPVGIEAYWHKRFEAKRRNGEWFDLSVQDVSAFRRRRFM